ncbi:MAG: hypothetical protein KAI63_01280, partial [Planctomycetes bacterium]|nr:hypothetical protein [Planctomycetota bacterium]
MGYQSDTLVYDTYYITKDFTYNLNKYWAIRPLRLVIPWLVLYWACLKYDIFQFFFQGGFLYGNIARYLEFPLLKLAGKKIIVSAYGADVRTEKATRALGKYNCCQDCQARLQACICDDQKGVRNIRHVKRWADISYAMGDMVEYTPGSRHDIFHWPIDLDKIEYVGVVASDGL